MPLLLRTQSMEESLLAEEAEQYQQSTRSTRMPTIKQQDDSDEESSSNESKVKLPSAISTSSILNENDVNLELKSGNEYSQNRSTSSSNDSFKSKSSKKSSPKSPVSYLSYQSSEANKGSDGNDGEGLVRLNYFDDVHAQDNKSFQKDF